ncbi:polysaccharide deacetylase family protein [Micropruina sp.]|uniref:polysaccharide deacetylase family protein n=1 Tax=Micropruina sp. TaxID=2737536 RepID=UPI0039E392A4
MNRKFPGSWPDRVACLLVAAGLVLTGCQYAGTSTTPSVRGGAPGSTGTTQVKPPAGAGKGESGPGNPAKPPTDGGTNKPPKVAKPPKRHGYSYRYGPNLTARVALTFDDCPRTLAEERTVLTGAAQLGIGLMLFPTGSCIQSKRFDAKFARSHGHYVFNHSNTHPQLSKLSYAGVLSQLSPPGVQSRYGRPPFGDWNGMVARAYAAKGMKIWLWTVDTNDWHGYSESYLVNYVNRTARAGDTVLMHMQWHGFSVDALRKMQAGLAKRGLEPCRNYGKPTPVRSWTVRC